MHISLLSHLGTALCLGTASYGLANEVSATSPASLEIGSPVLTSKWLEGSDYEQIVEFFITNSDGNNTLTWADQLYVIVESSSLETTTPGTLLRLGPKQSAVVQVGVKNKAGVKAGTQCDATAVVTWGPKQDSRKSSKDFSGQCGIGDYEASESSLEHHWNPDWFHEIKYGIFIHWGLYSIPAFGNRPGPKQDYAEWYGYRMTQPDFPSETYQYHRDTYGENFNYDNFVSNFTGANFDAEGWMNLVANAGAQYVVPVTKHHDGWALFDFPESVSKRSTVHYGPKRDFVKELLDVAKAKHPKIRRGTYFSMPEWFNPAYVKYAWDQHYKEIYWGRPPTNPYTNKSIEYTGYVEVDDFINDIQSPQIEALFYDYDIEMLWCDIGGPNKAPDVLAPWLNWARDQGRQVTFNDRCGAAGDYSTPEYSGISFNPRKFESNRGLDPFSFGYNYLTTDDEYLSGEEIVKTLVDNVVNNGNFLLNMGPKGDGTIPKQQQLNLLDAGEWIKAHGEGIFGTRYWPTAQTSGSLRFAMKPDAFYIHHVGKPSSQLVVKEPVPWVEGDEVTAVGGSAHGTVLQATRKDGSLLVQMPDKQEPKMTFPEDVVVERVDLSSKRTLVEAVKGQDAVVSTVSDEAFAAKKLSIDAAISAQVKCFIPSENDVDTREAWGNLALIGKYVVPSLTMRNLRMLIPALL
ncbi:alpha-L-fucosidase-domain-containing protein [Fusarium oxysporum]|nr:alpha-L-fucosidase-domain-containing protein [Fusarium oxysporum]